jgi:hypothetical protein
MSHNVVIIKWKSNIHHDLNIVPFDDYHTIQPNKLTYYDITIHMQYLKI